MKIKLNNVVLSFPQLEKPKGYQDSEPKYSATFLVDKSDPQATAVKDAINHVATELWKTKAAGLVTKLSAADRVCFRDGDAKEYDGYANRFYIPAKNKVKPKLVGLNKAYITDENEIGEKFYPGALVNAVIDIYAYDNGKGIQVISATLLGIQFAGHGDALGMTRTANDDDFETLGELETETADIFG